MNPTVYYAKDLLRTAEQVDAANRLVNCLLVRHLMHGERVSYWARKWGRSQAALHKSASLIRSLLVARENGYTDFTHAIPDPVPLRELEAKHEVYGPMLDDIEMEACMDLDDGRTEALIRAMFEKQPRVVFASRRGGRPEKKVKRGPGRPKGSKNKPKTPHHVEEGWLMPDGTRLTS